MFARPTKRLCVSSLAVTLLLLGSSHADVLRTNAVGCTASADAAKIAALQAKRDAAALATMTQPLVASRACIDLRKGVTVDIDERKPPMACVRLTGDLSCYWVAAALVDEHPGQKGGGGSGAKSGGRRH